jgi:hydrogenase nickel incorporation protein HypA/HybF
LHEMSIAEGIIDILREEMRKHNARALKRVTLLVGKLSMVVPESLTFCFQVLVEGTDLEGAELIVEIIPLRGVCHDCGKPFESQDYVFECPACKGPNIRLTDGQGIYISEMEIEERSE